MCFFGVYSYMSPGLRDRVCVLVLSAVANTSATEPGWNLSYHSGNIPGEGVHVSDLALEPLDGNDCRGRPDQMENRMEYTMSNYFA